MVLASLTITPTITYAEFVIDPTWPHVPLNFVHSETRAVEVDHATGEVYVGQQQADGAATVIVYDLNGSILRTWDDKYLQAPHGIKLDPSGEHVWVTDMNLHVVRKFTRDGTLVSTLGTPGTPGNTTNPLLFRAPTNVAFGIYGHMYIADGDAGINNRVLKFDADLKLVKEFGSFGTGMGQFYQPHDIKVDDMGRIWIADRGNLRMQAFHPVDESYLGEWSCVGKPFGIYLDLPRLYWVIVDGENNVSLVVNATMSKTNINDIGTCKVIEKWPISDTAHYVAVDGVGSLYVAEVTGKKCQKFIKQSYFKHQIKTQNL